MDRDFINKSFYNWGTFRNDTGILGMKSGVEAEPLPVLVAGFKGVVNFLAAGSNHLVAVCENGNVYTWGVGDQGQLVIFFD